MLGNREPEGGRRANRVWTGALYSSAVSRTDRASLVIDAPLRRTFDAFVDAGALEIWLPPDGMAAVFERFDPERLVAHTG